VSVGFWKVDFRSSLAGSPSSFFFPVLDRRAEAVDEVEDNREREVTGVENSTSGAEKILKSVDESIAAES